MLLQLLQLAGAAAILAMFNLSQRGVVSQTSWVYLLLNFTGGAVLAVLAALGQNWGFLMLEGGWAVTAFHGIFRRCVDTPAEGG